MDVTIAVLAGLVLLLGAGVAFLVPRIARGRQLEDRLDATLRAETRAIREEAETRGRDLRQEVGGALRGLADSLQGRVDALTTRLDDRLDRFGQDFTQSGEALRGTVEGRLDKLRAENAAKLEEMRTTVDDKLQSTLEKRLGESFNLVGQQLEQVHRGLGEMQSLAADVGGLKKVLANVKTRGGWGEVQLGSLLEQMLHPDQYVRNARVRADSNDVVEFAVHVPGQAALLPIDAKFPTEDYERLLAALDAGDSEAIDEAGRAIEARIRLEARRIASKYIEPPATTDVAVMFLPTEGLYAEVARRPGLLSELMQQHRVTVTGPTTLGAILTTIQWGGRAFAIQQRSADVARLLEKAKNEFGKFSQVIDKVQKQIDQAAKLLDSEVGVRTRAIERTLRDVEVDALPAADGTQDKLL
jgi:DNA recombination protein RmuC